MGLNADGARVPDVAYYYPEPFWGGGQADWIKSLLLFFDQIAILLPEYMYGQHAAADPALAGPLEEMGLLIVLRPETFVARRSRTDLLTRWLSYWPQVCSTIFLLPGTSPNCLDRGWVGTLTSSYPTRLSRSSNLAALRGIARTVSPCPSIQPSGQRSLSSSLSSRELRESGTA